jgi:hypothetical protein
MRFLYLWLVMIIEKDRMVCLPFVEPHEFCNKGLKMEDDFLHAD